MNKCVRKVKSHIYLKNLKLRYKFQRCEPTSELVYDPQGTGSSAGKGRWQQKRQISKRQAQRSGLAADKPNQSVHNWSVQGKTGQKQRHKWPQSKVY